MGSKIPRGKRPKNGQGASKHITSQKQVITPAFYPSLKTLPRDMPTPYFRTGMRPWRESKTWPKAQETTLKRQAKPAFDLDAATPYHWEMKELFILIDSATNGLHPDDNGLLEALAKHGIKGVPVVWEEFTPPTNSKILIRTPNITWLVFTCNRLVHEFLLNMKR